LRRQTFSILKKKSKRKKNREGKYKIFGVYNEQEKILKRCFGTLIFSVYEETDTFLMLDVSHG